MRKLLNPVRHSLQDLPLGLPLPPCPFVLDLAAVWTGAGAVDAVDGAAVV